MGEISEKLEKEYDHRIQQTLAELRDFYENQMKTNRAEFTRKYETKLSSLQNLLSQERSHNSASNGEQEEAQRRIHGLVQKVHKLESENFELNKQVKTALDMEIAVYTQLLETEEDRLGIKPENGLDDSFELGSDEEGEAGRSKITYKMTLSTENISEQRQQRSMAQTQI